MGTLPPEAVAVLTRLAEDFEAFCYACVRIRVLGKGDRWEYVPLELTDEQRAAVQARCDLVISAGAGAGKTRTLAARFLALLETGADLLEAGFVPV